MPAQQWQQHDASDDASKMMATMPGKQWRRPQRNEGVDTSGTPAKTPV